MVREAGKTPTGRSRVRRNGRRVSTETEIDTLVSEEGVPVCLERDYLQRPPSGSFKAVGTQGVIYMRLPQR